MDQSDQEPTTASFEKKVEASKSETEQKLQNFFTELPKMRMDSISQNLDSFNQSFRMEDPETSQERMTRLAEGLITNKSGDEWTEGEEWKFTLREEREFRRYLAKMGYVPWDFAKIPLKEVAQRTIKDLNFTLSTELRIYDPDLAHSSLSRFGLSSRSNDLRGLFLRVKDLKIKRRTTSIGRF